MMNSISVKFVNVVRHVGFNLTRNSSYINGRREIIRKGFHGINSQIYNGLSKIIMLTTAGAIGGSLTIRTINALSPSKAELELKLLLQQADDLYDENDFENLYELLLPHKDDKNADILWRLGRATYSRTFAIKDKKEVESLMREALTYVQEALSLAEDNFAVHKWMAILIDSVSAIDGSKARILQTFVVKEHMERACELNPKDATSWHVLGLWHYNIAAIPWYSRKAAAVIFATPPESSYDNALELFMKAEELEPDFYSKNLLMIAMCHYNKSENSEAIEYFKRARDYSAIKPTADDIESNKEAIEYLKKLRAS